MEAKFEQSILGFIRKLPARYVFGVFLGLSVYTGKYVINYLLPLTERLYIDRAVATKTVVVPEFYSIVAMLAGLSVLLLSEYVIIRKLRVSLYGYLYKKSMFRLLAVEKSRLSQYGVGYYNSIIVNLTQSMSNLIAPGLFDLAFSAANMLAVSILIATWDISIFFVLLVMYVLAAANTIVFYFRRKKELEIHNQDIALLSQKTQDAILNVALIKNENIISLLSPSIWDQLKKSLYSLNSFLRSLEVNRTGYSLCKNTAFILTLFLAVKHMLEGRMSYGQIFALIMYFEGLFSPFHTSITFLGDILNYKSWIRKYNTALSDTQGGEQSTKKSLYTEGIKSISLSGIAIDYLDKLSFDFELNRKVGLVGLSGEGKTSVVKLLLRDAKPLRGKIIVNDFIPAESVVDAMYYDAINFLPQSTDVFNDTLQNNVLLGKTLIHRDDESAAAMERIHSALKNFLNELNIQNPYISHLLLTYGCYAYELKTPQSDTLCRIRNTVMENYDKAVEYLYKKFYCEASEYYAIIEALKIQKLGDRLLGEGGNYCSGGEKQRIGAARFVLKNTASFYIMDEPFTSLDAITELEIMPLIQKKIQSMNGIIISHKLNVIEALCDYIYIIDGNKIEGGTANTLVNTNSTYKNLRASFAKLTNNITAQNT